METVYLASDNWAPAHPHILEAIQEANNGSTPAYGGDLWTEKAKTLLQDAFGRPAQIVFVPHGTGANILPSALLPSSQTFPNQLAIFPHDRYPFL